MIDLKTTHSFCQKLCRKIGTYQLAHLRQAHVTVQKDVRDFATDVDLGAEELIIHAIRQTFPDHNIRSEEKGFIDHHSHFTWVIDPLDGTKEYVKNIPLFTVNISLEDQNEVIIGAIYNPRTNELFSGAKTFGSFENRKPLTVSATALLENSIIGARMPIRQVKEPVFSKSWDTLRKLSQKAYRFRGTWHDGLVMSYVAKGAYDAYCLLFEGGPKWHDIAAGIPMVLGAGGKVTDRFGHPLKNGDLTKGLIASNGHIHQELLGLINQSV